MIDLLNPENGKKMVRSGDRLVDEAGNSFVKQSGAFRFVSDANYAENFGFEWNHFEKTQIDVFQQSDVSKDRWFAETGWDPIDLVDKDILEVGSGAGRFTRVVLEHTQANLHSVDYSNAVEANFRNNGESTRLCLYQADIYKLPFQKESFDKVFCFGVLQHTPSVKQSIRALAEMVKPGGELVVDFYPYNGFYTYLNTKYFLRPFLRRMPSARLLKLIESNIDWMMGVSMFFTRIGVGRVLNRLLPICNIDETIPIQGSIKQLREWAVLDTFDMFSPRYDQPQKMKNIKRWFEEFGLTVTFSDVVHYCDGQAKAPVVRGRRLR